MQHRLLAVVGAVALIAVGCDDGVPDLDTEPAAERIRALLDANGADVDLDECPVADFSTLLADSFELLDDQLVRDALVGASRSTTFSTDSTPAAGIACELVDESGATAGFVFLDAPADLAAFTSDLATGSLDGVTVDVDESRLYRGGRFHRVCADADTSALDSCAVDWLDDDVMIGVFATGEGAIEIDVDDLQERFEYLLPTIVERLGDD
ncbi:hypothetical protein [Ilumatobacter coccineus]|uniref:Uncharacterized protein n=1 Tax=Ilumatobacter coccineus (strain NBRC 103263 / KCTC 29153 / YM16-304) TaxID=1313172 RepID=A0A6C7EAL2_ILUCY|nr:hypothetical protein [Ilumatobacter coccineus]BAN03373.1 hypothetical protein YM304_30590 [Ilumatobacter coccineus YM16-304]